MARPAPRERVYRGWRERGEGGAGVVRWQDGGRPARRLDARHDIRNHSPDGFQWGYAGSGPAQLALALVCDATGDPDLAQRTYQRFKFAVVAGLGDSWQLTAGDIVDRVAAISLERERS